MRLILIHAQPPQTCGSAHLHSSGHRRSLQTAPRSPWDKPLGAKTIKSRKVGLYVQFIMTNMRTCVAEAASSFGFPLNLFLPWRSRCTRTKRMPFLAEFSLWCLLSGPVANFHIPLLFENRTVLLGVLPPHSNIHSFCLYTRTLRRRNWLRGCLMIIDVAGCSMTRVPCRTCRSIARSINLQGMHAKLTQSHEECKAQVEC